MRVRSKNIITVIIIHRLQLAQLNQPISTEEGGLSHSPVQNTKTPESVIRERRRRRENAKKHPQNPKNPSSSDLPPPPLLPLLLPQPPPSKFHHRRRRCKQGRHFLPLLLIQQRSRGPTEALRGPAPPPPWASPSLQALRGSQPRQLAWGAEGWILCRGLLVQGGAATSRRSGSQHQIPEGRSVLRNPNFLRNDNFVYVAYLDI